MASQSLGGRGVRGSCRGAGAARQILMWALLKVIKMSLKLGNNEIAREVVGMFQFVNDRR